MIGFFRWRRSQTFQVGFGLALLVCLAWYIDLPVLLQNFSSIDPLMAAGLCVACLLDRIFMAYKWNILLAARGVHISVWYAIRLYVLGNLIGTITPGGLGADAYRVVALSARHPAEVVLSSVFLERLLGMAVIASIAAVMLPVSASYFTSDSSVLVGMVLGGALLTVLVIPFSLSTNLVDGIVDRIPGVSGLKVTKKLRHFHRVYSESRDQVGTLVLFTGLTVVEVGFRILLSYVAAISLQIAVEFWFMLCMMPMVFILGRLPITLQGIGIQEGLFAYVMVLGGHSAENGVAVVLLLRAAGWVAMLFPALYHFLCPRTIVSNPSPSDRESLIGSPP